MKIVLMGYHNIGCIVLKLLKKHNHNVISVFTHRDNLNENIWFSSLSDLANKHGIRVFYSDSFDNEDLYNLMMKFQPDLIFSAYYRNLIPDRILNIAKYGGVNIHSSYLPKYRGRVPVNWQIINGENEGGVTLHYMTKKADAGDIIAQNRIIIDGNDPPLELFKKIEELSVNMLEEELHDIKNWRGKAFAQNHKAATVYPGRKPEDGLIDWNKKSEDIFNLVRGITKPYPGAFSFIRDTKIFIWKSKVRDDLRIKSNYKPGKVIEFNNENFVITANGYVELVEVSLSNDHRDYKVITINDMLKFGNQFNNKLK